MFLKLAVIRHNSEKEARWIETTLNGKKMKFKNTRKAHKIMQEGDSPQSIAQKMQESGLMKEAASSYQDVVPRKDVRKILADRKSRAVIYRAEDEDIASGFRIGAGIGALPGGFRALEASSLRGGLKKLLIPIALAGGTGALIGSVTGGQKGKGKVLRQHDIDPVLGGLGGYIKSKE